MAVGRSTEPRSVTVTKTDESTAVTGGAGTFVPVRDVGRPIAGTGIPAGTTLAAVASDTAATLSAAATATGAGAATIGGPGGTAPGTYGFCGWVPESETEAAAYTVAAVNAGTETPDRITDTTTPITRRARTAS
jgi:hypothetical protein